MKCIENSMENIHINVRGLRVRHGAKLITSWSSFLRSQHPPKICDISEKKILLFKLFIENKTLLFRLAEGGMPPLHLICSYSGYQWLIRKQDTIILRQKIFVTIYSINCDKSNVGTLTFTEVILKRKGSSYHTFMSLEAGKRATKKRKKTSIIA